jgi:hypothetical protein
MPILPKHKAGWDNHFQLFGAAVQAKMTVPDVAASG